MQEIEEDKGDTFIFIPVHNKLLLHVVISLQRDFASLQSMT